MLMHMLSLLLMHVFPAMLRFHKIGAILGGLSLMAAALLGLRQVLSLPPVAGKTFVKEILNCCFHLGCDHRICPLQTSRRCADYCVSAKRAVL